VASQSIQGGQDFQSKTNPEKRVENPRGILFLQKDNKKK
jgi:hypothetical protein